MTDHPQHVLTRLPWTVQESNGCCFIGAEAGTARRFYVYFEANPTRAAQDGKMTRADALALVEEMLDGLTAGAWEP
jgi:hypothetical protein